MKEAICALCALSVLCGMAQLLAPEGAAKRSLTFVSAVVLLAGGVRLLREPEWERYALEARQLQIREESYLQQNTEKLRSLDRRVIEAEYGAYILDMAAKQGLDVRQAEVKAAWSMDGLWLPYSLWMEGDMTLEEQQRFSGRIEAELGIPLERQTWRQASG